MSHVVNGTQGSRAIAPKVAASTLGPFAKWVPASQEYRFRTSSSGSTVAACVKPGMAKPGEFKSKQHPQAAVVNVALTRSVQCGIRGEHVIVHLPAPTSKKLSTSLSAKLEPAQWRCELKGKGWLRPVVVTTSEPRLAFNLPGLAERKAGELSVRVLTIAASGAWSLWSDWVKLDPAVSCELALPGPA